MFAVRRWWERYGRKIGFFTCALLTAIILRQTQGAAILEVYYFISKPFQSKEKELILNKLRNARIQELEEKIIELNQQNQQLKKLLKYTETIQEPVVTAVVIGRNSEYWWQEIIINRGSKDGIKPGYIVSSIGGLVGRVIHVTPHTSQVLLISNQNQKIGAAISRSRSLGLIKGENSQVAVMEFFDKVPDVKKGDVVSTSSVSRLFPPGMPIGIIESVTEGKRAAPQAKVRITAPLNLIEWVLVHPFTEFEKK